MISWICSIYNWAGIKNMLSSETLRWMLRYSVDNFVSSQVFSLIFVMFVGLGLFIHSGLSGVLLRLFKKGNRRFSGKERKSLILVSIVAVLYFMAFSILAWGPWNIVRGVTGRFTDSPLHDGIWLVLSVGVGLVSLTYGISTDHYRRDRDIITGMSYMFFTYPTYIVTFFFLSQFMAILQYSGLSAVIGLKGCLFEFVYWVLALFPLIKRE